MRAFLLAAAAGLGLAGCVIIADDGPDDDFDFNASFGAGDSRLERLYGATVAPDGLHVQVASNGCTSEDSFDIDVDRIGGPGYARYRVRLERDTPDHCRALMADGVELFFSRQRLGLADDAVIQVVNRVER